VASSADGHVIFDPEWFGFIGDDSPAPDTVNPSLWRQSQVMRRGDLQDGGQSALAAYAGLLDEFDLNFNIVTP
jgi:alkyl sulfatase BDS1-like metallo-beta-lactamase superfamily hydrolase